MTLIVFFLKSKHCFVFGLFNFMQCYGSKMKSAPGWYQSVLLYKLYTYPLHPGIQVNPSMLLGKLDLELWGKLPLTFPPPLPSSQGQPQSKSLDDTEIRISSLTYLQQSHVQALPHLLQSKVACVQLCSPPSPPPSDAHWGRGYSYTQATARRFRTVLKDSSGLFFYFPQNTKYQRVFVTSNAFVGLLLLLIWL